MNPLRTPTESHPIAVAATQVSVVVIVASKVIADTARALILDETSGGRVFYIPRQDVDMALLKRSKHVIHDAGRGEAACYSIPAGGRRSRDAAWSFEAPLPCVAGLKDYLAFTPGGVDAILEWPGD
jgi:uncharacterized protein (DUF427 family)